MEILKGKRHKFFLFSMECTNNVKYAIEPQQWLILNSNSQCCATDNSHSHNHAGATAHASPCAAYAHNAQHSKQQAYHTENSARAHNKQQT
jgi:hypothetical protein